MKKKLNIYNGYLAMDLEKHSTQYLDIMNKQAQELSCYEQQFDNADFHMLQHVIDYSKMAIKSLFLLNGTAAISVFTLFTSSSLNIQKVFQPLLDAVTIFSWGAFFSVICIFLAYTAQKFYQDECACIGREKILHIKLRQSKEKRIFFAKEKVLNKEIPVEKNIKVLENEVEDTLKQKDLEEKKEKRYGRLGDIFTSIAIIGGICSLCLFIFGVYKVKQEFIQYTKDTITEQNK